MIKFSLISASIFGLIAVALGAFGAHGLKNVLSEYGKGIFQTAVLYQMFHALALLMNGILQYLLKDINLAVSAFSFFCGILIFSGSLYILAITEIKWLGAITPLGGVSFLVGWAWLVYQLFKIKIG